MGIQQHQCRACTDATILNFTILEFGKKKNADEEIISYVFVLIKGSRCYECISSVDSTFESCKSQNYLNSPITKG